MTKRRIQIIRQGTWKEKSPSVLCFLRYSWMIWKRVQPQWTQKHKKTQETIFWFHQLAKFHQSHLRNVNWFVLLFPHFPAGCPWATWQYVSKGLKMFMFFYLVISRLVVCLGIKSTEKVFRPKGICTTLFIVAKNPQN